MPTRPNGVPSGRCGDSLPSLASGGSVLRLVDAVDALVGHQGPRPLLVVLRIVLDQQHLARLVDRLAGLDQVDAAVERRAVYGVLMVDRAGRPDGEQVVVRRAGGMRDLADARRILLAADRRVGDGPSSLRANGVSASMPYGLNGKRT